MLPKVLIVDDSTTMRHTLQLLLCPDFDCSTAPNGAIALAQALEQPPDLILSDVWMDDMDGYELRRRVRAEPTLQHVHFVFLSGQPPQEREGESSSVYLRKPVPPALLVTRLQEVLRHGAEPTDG